MNEPRDGVHLSPDECELVLGWYKAAAEAGYEIYRDDRITAARLADPVIDGIA